jgi:hypothetical protein
LQLSDFIILLCPQQAASGVLSAASWTPPSVLVAQRLHIYCLQLSSHAHPPSIYGVFKCEHTMRSSFNHSFIYSVQVPDFTIHLTGAVEADAFISATADSLPPDAIRSTDDRRAPIGKVVLFTTRSSVPGMYKALAAQHFGRSRLLFGWTTTADEDGPAVALMQKMNVSRIAVGAVETMV